MGEDTSGNNGEDENEGKGEGEHLNRFGYRVVAVRVRGLVRAALLVGHDRWLVYVRQCDRYGCFVVKPILIAHPHIQRVRVRAWCVCVRARV